MKWPKIYYLPGIISLVFIPIFCIVFLYLKNGFTEYTVIDISMYDPQYWGPIPERNYEKFIVNDTVVNLKFQEIKQRIKKMVKENDTINGVQIQFSESARYEDFIKTVDLLYYRVNAKSFIYDKNTIWVFEIPRMPNIEQFECGCCFDYNVRIEKEVPLIDKVKIFFKYYKNYNPIIIGYLVFLIFVFFGMYRIEIE